MGATPLAAPNRVAWPCGRSAAAAVLPTAVNDCLRGAPDWAATASGMGDSMPADPEPNEPEPNEPEPNKLETAADDAIDSALVGVMTGAAKGTAGAKPAEGAAAGSAAEAGAVPHLVL